VIRDFSRVPEIAWLRNFSRAAAGAGTMFLIGGCRG
jgi:hypothetical protein